MNATNNFFVIVDSSVAVKWITADNEEHLEEADAILKNASQKKFTIAMPELAKYEIGNALLYKKLALPLLQTLVDSFYHLPIQFIAEDIHTAQQTAELAHDYKITYYDASFLSLALTLKGPLITDNPKHQKKKVSGLTAISLKDYR